MKGKEPIVTKHRIQITRATFVAGKAVESGAIVEVTEAEALSLKASGKGIAAKTPDKVSKAKDKPA